MSERLYLNASCHLLPSASTRERQRSLWCHGGDAVARRNRLREIVLVPLWVAAGLSGRPAGTQPSRRWPRRSLRPRAPAPRYGVLGARVRRRRDPPGARQPSARVTSACRPRRSSSGRPARFTRVSWSAGSRGGTAWPHLVVREKNPLYHRLVERVSPSARSGSRGHRGERRSEARRADDSCGPSRPACAS